MTDITPEDLDDLEDADDELPDDFQPGRPVIADKPDLDIPATPADDVTDTRTPEDI